MSISTCVYLQTSNYFSCDIIFYVLADILSLEGKDNASHGRAKLRAHRFLLPRVCICVKSLDNYKGSRTFLAVSVQPQLYNVIVSNLKFMFYREFVKLTFYLNSKLNR